MANEKKLFTLGTDSEFFLRDKKSGKFVSAIPLIKGTKKVPHKLNCGSGVHHDNVALEFATKVTYSEKDLISSISQTFSEIYRLIPSNLEVCCVQSILFDPSELRDDEAKEFGCDPDFNAWYLFQNPAPEVGDVGNLRSCGGHIHIGAFGNNTYNFLLYDKGKISLVRILDAVLGIVFTVLEDSKEAKDRRKIYGKAGACRFKSYGVEYRTLSNFWVGKKSTVSLVYRLVEDALDIVENRLDKSLIEDIGEEELISVIDNCDSERAAEIFDDHIYPYCVSDASSVALEMAIMDKSESLRGEWVNSSVFSKVSLPTKPSSMEDVKLLPWMTSKVEKLNEVVVKE